MDNDALGIKIDNIKEKLGEHIDDDNKKFERMFNYLKDQFGKIDGSFDELSTKVDTLWDASNQQKGAMGMARFVAAGIGGICVGIVDYFVKGH